MPNDINKLPVLAGGKTARWAIPCTNMTPEKLVLSKAPPHLANMGESAEIAAFWLSKMDTSLSSGRSPNSNGTSAVDLFIEAWGPW
eukprot:CAMPEP_0114544496 /NCGR_PEP_ID=MMETSP0114-20121206/2909_1 /TAXON_ID=31324 /ORGANISM="Goniomonas sp, Strain m" /LENGTH=85 /DNA_ID=CAMNT_0001728883 /DNA_START=137 /DNA_END=392 /DNA_ORIENTATION=+